MITLYINVRIHTLDSERPAASALLARDGLVDALYDAPPSLPGVPRVDLQGTVVCPGFIDAHTHSFEGGLYNLGADLSLARRLDDVFGLLASTAPLSGMVFAWRFDETAIAEQRFPTCAEMDRVVPDVPCLLRRVDGHSCQVNTAALRAIDWRGHSPPDDSGLLLLEHNDIAAHWFHRQPNDEAVLRCYDRAAAIALAAGCTTVHTMVGDTDRDPLHYALLRNNLDRFPVEYLLYPQIFDADRAASLGATRVGGCILVDGSLGSHTAALRQPYADMPGTSGRLYRNEHNWRDFVGRAHELGLQVSAHAIGDAAIERFVAAVEVAQRQQVKKAQRGNSCDLRHAIIHCELTDDALLDRMAAAGIVAVMQPAFDRLWAAGLYTRVLGQERASRTNRLASMLSRGIHVAAGSDWYITPLDPLAGMRAAVNMHNPAESLSPQQALGLWTTGAAYLSRDENRLGHLSPGLQADFVCLADDPLGGDEPPAVLRVVKRGETVYET
ncbi:MAG: amidohydrolase [Candidatus Cloacimonetes bacterium]|nr:amidohydrolase [Candidatus Cloacimonadota bacterium]